MNCRSDHKSKIRLRNILGQPAVPFFVSFSFSLINSKSKDLTLFPICNK